MSEILVNTIKKADGTGSITVPAETGTVLTSGGAIDVNASAPADSVSIDSSGRVGIGVTPTRALSVKADDGYIHMLNASTGTSSTDGSFIGVEGGTTALRIVQQESDVMSFHTSGLANERMRIDASGNVGIGTSSPSDKLHVNGGSLRLQGAGDGAYATAYASGGNLVLDSDPANTGGGSSMLFGVDGTERMRIDSSGNVMIGKTVIGLATDGCAFEEIGVGGFACSNATPLYVNRNGNDGELVSFRQANTPEGNISVSGSTVSYNGGHLARWSRLADDSKDTSIVKGTVMTNLDAMVVWSHDAVDEVLDEEGNVVTEAKEAYTEDNEQLNKMAVSSVEGDPNVAGVFVNWDESDDFNDMNIAMTGDMVIRIASGTTVARGDLLMSAGDGTAKPQGDDIVRSKTIAKVTSTHVSHTYDDGSYLVPCVLMAC